MQEICPVLMAEIIANIEGLRKPGCRVIDFLGFGVCFMAGGGGCGVDNELLAKCWVSTGQAGCFPGGISRA